MLFGLIEVGEDRSSCIACGLDPNMDTECLECPNLETEEVEEECSGDCDCCDTPCHGFQIEVELEDLVYLQESLKDA